MDMKRVFRYIVMSLVLTPTLLTFSTSQDGGVTVWNFVGLVYTFLLAVRINAIEIEKKNRK